MESFYQSDEKWIAIGELATSYLENSWDKDNLRGVESWEQGTW